MGADRRDGGDRVLHPRRVHPAGEPSASAANGGAGAALRAGSGDHGDHRSRYCAGPRRLVDLDRKSAPRRRPGRVRAGRVDAQRLRDHRRRNAGADAGAAIRGLGCFNLWSGCEGASGGPFNCLTVAQAKEFGSASTVHPERRGRAAFPRANSFVVSGKPDVARKAIPLTVSSGSMTETSLKRAEKKRDRDIPLGLQALVSARKNYRRESSRRRRSWRLHFQKSEAIGKQKKNQGESNEKEARRTRGRFIAETDPGRGLERECLYFRSWCSNEARRES